MPDPRIPVSYSLPRTNAKVLALLEPHLSSAALVLDIGAGEGYLAQRVHAAITERGLCFVLRHQRGFQQGFATLRRCQLQVQTDQFALQTG